MKNQTEMLDKITRDLNKLNKFLDRLERIQRSQSKYIAQVTGYIEAKE